MQHLITFVADDIAKGVCRFQSQTGTYWSVSQLLLVMQAAEWLSIPLLQITADMQYLESMTFTC